MAGSKWNGSFSRAQHMSAHRPRVGNNVDGDSVMGRSLPRHSAGSVSVFECASTESVDEAARRQWWRKPHAQSIQRAVESSVRAAPYPWQVPLWRVKRVMAVNAGRRQKRLLGRQARSKSGLATRDAAIKLRCCMQATARACAACNVCGGGGCCSLCLGLRLPAGISLPRWLSTRVGGGSMPRPRRHNLSLKARLSAPDAHYGLLNLPTRRRPASCGLCPASGRSRWWRRCRRSGGTWRSASQLRVGSRVGRG